MQAAKKSAKYSPTGVLTGIAVEDAPVRSWQEKHAERMESCARMMQSGLSFPALSGRVGDCCDDEADTQVRHASLHFIQISFSEFPSYASDMLLCTSTKYRSVNFLHSIRQDKHCYDCILRCD